MKSLLGIVIGFLIAWVLLKNTGAFSALGGAISQLGGTPHEQINGSTTTYSLDGNAPSATPAGFGGCGCGG
jgi:hypothetical protein